MPYSINRWRWKVDSLGEVLTVQLVVSYFVSALIQWLKTSKLPALGWITTTTSGVNRFVAAVFATATAAGMHWQYDAATGAFALSGTIGALQDFALDWGRAWIAQKGWYKFLIKNSGVP